MENVIVNVLVVVFSVVFHEVAHGWTALKLGDPTARDAGRITLNPLPHIDPFGSIILPALLALSGSITLGWAKPVPVHPGRLNNPRDDHPRVAAAGPASNLLLALMAALGLGATMGLGGAPAWMLAEGAKPGVGTFFFALFQTAIFVNVALALFNMLPVPPLDGSWILQRFLPPEAQVRYFAMRRFGMFFILGFLALARYTALGGVLQRVFLTVVTPFFELATHLARSVF